MPGADGVTSASFRGEPGEPSPDAVGGWPASDVQEYLDWHLMQTVREHTALYGAEATRQAVERALSEACDG